MPKYNRNVRTKKYSDTFKSTTIFLSCLGNPSVESLDIHPVKLSIWRRVVNEGKIVIDKRKNVLKKSKKLKESQVYVC